MSELGSALDHVLDAIALNDAQTLALHNPDPEVNSLAERILDLHRQGVPTQALADLLSDIRSLIDLNAAERGAEQHAAGLLDELLRTLYMRARHQQAGSRLTVQGAAKALRGPLRVLRDPMAHDATAFVTAARAVGDVIDCCPARMLRSPTLRHELRASLHDQLLALIDTEPIGTEVAA